MRNDKPCPALVGTVDDGCPCYCPVDDGDPVCIDCGQPFTTTGV